MRSRINIIVSQTLIEGSDIALRANGTDFNFYFFQFPLRERDIRISTHNGVQTTFISRKISETIGQNILLDVEIIQRGESVYELVVTALEDNVTFNLVSNNSSLGINTFNQQSVEPFVVLSETLTNVSEDLYNYTVVTNKSLGQTTLSAFNSGNPFDIEILPEFISQTNFAGDTLSLNLQKYEYYQLDITDLSDLSNVREYTIFREPIRLLNPDNILFRTDRVGGGVNVTLSYSETTSFPLEWSLNFSEYQSSAFYLNQEAGEYTVSIRDSIGQEVSTQIILRIQSSEPYFTYSKLNSIRGAKQETIDNRFVHRNDDNTLSFQEDVECVKGYTYNYLNSDSVRLQFKTNFDTVTADALGMVNTSLTVEKKSNNLNRKTAYTATATTQGNSTFITFGSGNILDFNDTTQVLDRYILNDRLPFWAQQGAIIEINGGEYMIDRIINNFSGTTRRAIQINNIGSKGSIVVKARFDLLPYEVYEVDVPVLSYINSCFQVRIQAIDGRFRNIEFLTEKIQINNSLKKHSYFVWRSTENNDVDYSTGIFHNARFAVTKQSSGFLQEQEIFNSDTNSYLTSSQNIKTISLEFDLLTTGVAESLVFALSAKSLFIDGVGYVKNEAFEIEGALDKSNLYRVTAQLVESGFNFDFIDFEQEAPLSFTNFDIPSLDRSRLIGVNHGSGLVTTDDGFVSNP